MAKNNISQIDTIGSVELIDFPELSANQVPARIDTGAIFSSIWASDIVEKNGMLSFKLFGPGSVFLNGETIKTGDFRTTSVKNSFGQSEFRYKVRLQINIAGRKIRAWFTLANRSSMTYPVLVGRNVLRNKFVVDVSRHPTRGKSLAEVLVLASEAHDFDSFFAELTSYNKKTNYTVRDYKELVFKLLPGKVSVYESLTGRDIGEFDLVYFKSHKRDYPLAIAAAHYAQFRGAKVIDQEILSSISYDKLSESLKLAFHGIAVPPSFCASTSYIVENIDEIAEQIGWPLVCKEINEDKGRKNYLLDNASELKTVLEDASEADIYIIQRYVPNDGFVRALVLDREVALVMRRAAIPREDKLKRHLNKLAGAGNVVLLPPGKLDPQADNLSVRAAVAMNRQVAGVDVIQDKNTGEWFILEVNNAPQIASGPFLDERKRAVAEFINRQIYS